MKFQHLLTLLFFCTLSVNLNAQEATDSLPPAPPAPPALERVALQDYSLSMNNEGGVEQLVFKAAGLSSGFDTISVNGEAKRLEFKAGTASTAMETDQKGQLLFIENPSQGSYQLFHISETGPGQYRIRSIPLWLSILPPLIAIGLALVFKEVIISLFVGIWAGAFVVSGLRVGYLFSSFLEVIEKYVIKALNDGGHLSVIVFSLLIGGMVAIISRNGGMAGVVLSLSKYARSPRSTQFITWLLGVAIFFDDYANTLIVGNTMRSVTDKFKISREKLAYIVDSTAAPVAAVAFITTWIGAELGYIEGGIKLLDNFDASLSPYAIFISSLKYSFYPILTLSFILILIYTKRDYGKMLKAELRARSTGQVSPAATPGDDEPNMEDLSPVEGAPLKWHNAALPVLAVILMTIYGLVSSGMDALQGELLAAGVSTQGWGDIWGALGSLSDGDQPSFFMKLGTLIGSSDSYVALLWASLSGVLLAIILTLSSRIMSLFDTMHTLGTGFKTMLPALMILTLAWSLAITTEELYTANYLTLLVQDSVSPYALPGIIFILSALIAFSTGSSWSTMAILYPIAIPTTWAVCQSQGIAPEVSMELLLNVIATVLAASVLGDHCSPISDTTILSSLASDCNHIDHVQTQMPYALTVGSVSLIGGTLVTFLGGGLLMSLLILVASLGTLYAIVMRFGKVVD
ncbi:MAG: Na+/H+ antiporter NhaC family protein [Bacteroidota bacterium]